jgi:hypothetical protein
MKPSIRLGGWSLYGAIAVQLVFEVSRTDGMVICTSCGTPFLPATRRPRRDQNTDCLDCGKKAAARDAAARYRRTETYRMARARRLASRLRSGHSSRDVSSPAEVRLGRGLAVVVVRHEPRRRAVGSHGRS